VPFGEEVISWLEEKIVRYWVGSSYRIECNKIYAYLIIRNLSAISISLINHDNYLFDKDMYITQGYKSSCQMLLGSCAVGKQERETFFDTLSVFLKSYQYIKLQLLNNLLLQIKSKLHIYKLLLCCNHLASCGKNLALLQDCRYISNLDTYSASDQSQ